MVVALASRFGVICSLNYYEWLRPYQILSFKNTYSSHIDIPEQYKRCRN